MNDKPNYTGIKFCHNCQNAGKSNRNHAQIGLSNNIYRLKALNVQNISVAKTQHVSNKNSKSMAIVGN